MCMDHLNPWPIKALQTRRSSIAKHPDCSPGKKDRSQAPCRRPTCCNSSPLPLSWQKPASSGRYLRNDSSACAVLLSANSFFKILVMFHPRPSGASSSLPVSSLPLAYFELLHSFFIKKRKESSRDVFTVPPDIRSKSIQFLKRPLLIVFDSVISAIVSLLLSETSAWITPSVNRNFDSVPGLDL